MAILKMMALLLKVSDNLFLLILANILLYKKISMYYSNFDKCVNNSVSFTRK